MLKAWLKTRKKGVAAHLICLALVANAFAVGIWGLDYGTHWDEWQFRQGLKNAINDVSLLLRHYTYGGMYFNVGFLLLLPRALPLLSGILAQIVANPTRPLAVDQYPALVSAKAQLLSVV